MDNSIIMIGNYYAIEIGVTSPEIEKQIDEVKFGRVRYLVGNPDFDRIIEAQKIDHPKAYLLDATLKKYLLDNFTPKEELI